jgi:hypothetical protein
MPTVVTEQYPKVRYPGTAPVVTAAVSALTQALGHTVTEIDTAGLVVLEKTKFSMVPDEGLGSWGQAAECDSFVIMGMESHVCVQQTALDLMAEGRSRLCSADPLSLTKWAFEANRCTSPLTALRVSDLWIRQCGDPIFLQPLSQ